MKKVYYLNYLNNNTTYNKWLITFNAVEEYLNLQMIVIYNRGSMDTYCYMTEEQNMLFKLKFLKTP
jgi:hypothetical protein